MILFFFSINNEDGICCAVDTCVNTEFVKLALSDIQSFVCMVIFTSYEFVLNK